MNNNQANSLSGNLIPNVLSSLINKTNDPNDSGFSLEKLIGSITGNKTDVALSQNTGGGGLQDMLRQITGDGNGTGGGLMDIVKNLAGGAQQQQKKNGNLLDLIKGFTN